MNRPDLIAQLAGNVTYDIAIIGGGATGLGVALDAVTRGLRVVLVESHDFSQGASSRATKLVHGGVRYLAQGNISLVREALRERAALLRNAPHLAQPLPFVMPCYKRWESSFYGLGLKLYDVLAGKASLGPTKLLDPNETQRCLPTVLPQGLRGGVEYWDGQFDDARLALALARSAAARGALLVNYCGAYDLHHEGGKVVGFHCEDKESGQRYLLRAGCVVNATGVWVDELREKDGVGVGTPFRPMVAASQGVHLVVDRDFLPGNHALLVPKTIDGRVLFAIPWLGKVILGTTDTPRRDLAREPEPLGEEIDFILRESSRYLNRAPARADVKSMWVGLRPLVRCFHKVERSSMRRSDAETRDLSRKHSVVISRTGLVTVTGGKWTTYRAMAEDVLNKCVGAALVKRVGASTTSHLKLIGADGAAFGGAKIGNSPGLHSYGGEQGAVLALPGARRQLGGGLSEAMVRFAARREYARTVEDVLARRNRMLFLDAGLAASLASKVGEILQQETGGDPQIAAFCLLAQRYRCPVDT